ncbi:MAG: 4-alpha-glucanotransferase [Candidatus Promineifilaceae bacterium]|jgi:4-alpha-glucanotransferase
MKLTFSIHYQTDWGQSLRLVIPNADGGDWEPTRALVMEGRSAGVWSLTLTLADAELDAFYYKYSIVSDHDGTCRAEHGDDRTLPRGLHDHTHVRMLDSWRMPSPEQEALKSSVFTRVVYPPEGRLRARKTKASIVAGNAAHFRVFAPRVPKGCALAMLGSIDVLGAWSIKDAVLMSDADYPTWSLTLPLDSSNTYFEYKYVAVPTGAEEREVEFESGENRLFVPSVEVPPPTLTVKTDEQLESPRGPWRGTGVAVPVFALRSRTGLGVGEFIDIRPLAEWAEQVGMNMIQLLPINDTIATHTWKDSYPYAAISVFALHPIYMNLAAMGVFDTATTDSMIGKDQARLNALPEVDYEDVMRVKSRFFKQAFDHGRKHLLADASFNAFVKENKKWLLPYAVFSCLRDRYGTCEHQTWPEHRRMTMKDCVAFASPKADHFDDVAVHYFIQYHLHLQLLDAATYARERGVALKADIPIGVFRHSVDTWMDPDSFNMDGQAGSPPDYFSIDGQNWGFPTYNWEVMARTDYSWWRNRLIKLSTYFDAFRIDHILGFFRMWEIPTDAISGTLGRFNPALPLGREELAARGVPFDKVRLCEPHIRENMLAALFDEDARLAVRAYFKETAPGCFQLHKEFQTQRDIAEHFDQALARGEADNGLRAGLMAIVQDRLLLDAPHSKGKAFNPRMGMENTWSFRELDPAIRNAFWNVYVDYFHQRHERFWAAQARLRLPAITEATDMLICGEDLGMVPACVPSVMDQFGILCLRIQRMPVDASQDYQHPADYPYRCVASPSSHDISSLRAWWLEERRVIQHFYNVCLGREGEAPQTCTPELVQTIIDQHLCSPAMWAVFPIQDLLGMDAQLQREDPRAERINDPANNPHYWRYRCHMSLEDMLDASAFNSALRDRIASSGRGH